MSKWHEKIYSFAYHYEILSQKFGFSFVSDTLHTVTIHDKTEIEKNKLPKLMNICDNWNERMLMHTLINILKNSYKGFEGTKEDNTSYHDMAIAGRKNAIVPKKWKKSCASDGNE